MDKHPISTRILAPNGAARKAPASLPCRADAFVRPANLSEEMGACGSCDTLWLFGPLSSFCEFFLGV